MTWPWPGDTQLDAARRVARSYREVLLEVAPEACAGLDAKISGWGQEWIAPTLTTVDEHAWVTLDEAAAHTGKAVITMYQWCTRDERLTWRRSDAGRMVVRLGEVLEVHAEMRRRRAAGRGAAPSS